MPDGLFFPCIPCGIVSVVFVSGQRRQSCRGVMFLPIVKQGLLPRQHSSQRTNLAVSLVSRDGICSEFLHPHKNGFLHNRFLDVAGKCMLFVKKER